MSLARVATLPSVSSLSIQLLYLNNIIKYSTRSCHLIYCPIVLSPILDLVLLIDGQLDIVLVSELDIVKNWTIELISWVKILCKNNGGLNRLIRLRLGM